MVDASAEEELDLLRSGKRELNWFAKHVKELLPHYDRKFVAVQNESIVASSSDLHDLLAQLRAAGRDPGRVLIEFVQRNPPILIS